jgi:hypothetical protein
MKELIPCTICKHPQCVDLYEMQLTLAKTTNTTLDERLIHKLDCICHRCTNTQEYKSEYLLCNKEHFALPHKTEVRS